MLACVLALDGADLGTVGAVASELERHLRITNTQIGLLASVVSFSAAVTTIPIGALSDHVSRSKLLSGSVGLWSAAMLVAGMSSSYVMLLGTRAFLGAVQSTSGPTLASLIGDYFPAGERGRINGYILSGELVGGGAGFLLSGAIAAVLSWRWAFWILTAPGALLAVALWRGLPEPARGSQSRLQTADVVQETIANGHRAPRSRVLDEDPRRISLWRAVRYVLRVRTNLVVMTASALGYFFFGGVRTFALIFVRGHFGLGQASATGVLAVVGLGALAGILIGGRLADLLIRRGTLDARLLVGGLGYLAAAALFTVPLVTTSVPLALALFLLASGALTAPNPPLDAARLDVMPAFMWGRAEGVRAVARTFAVGVAPLLFGWVADQIARPGEHELRAVGATATNGHALELTFLMMLVPVAVGGWVLLWGRRHYERDVAAASESQDRWSPPSGQR